MMPVCSASARVTSRCATARLSGLSRSTAWTRILVSRKSAALIQRVPRRRMASAGDMASQAVYHLGGARGLTLARVRLEPLAEMLVQGGLVRECLFPRGLDEAFVGREGDVLQCSGPCVLSLVGSRPWRHVRADEPPVQGRAIQALDCHPGGGPACVGRRRPRFGSRPPSPCRRTLKSLRPLGSRPRTKQTVRSCRTRSGRAPGSCATSARGRWRGCAGCGRHRLRGRPGQAHRGRWLA
jgi:hypothetical protein